MQGTWVSTAQQEKQSCSVKVICSYSTIIRVILTAAYRRALINGAAAGGTTLAASAQPLIPYFSGSYDQSWTTSHHLFFPPKVQKVLKSLLENCQAFIKRTELLFLGYFYLLCQKRHHVALAAVYFKLLSVLSFSGQTPGFLQSVEVQHVHLGELDHFRQ